MAGGRRGELPAVAAPAGREHWRWWPASAGEGGADSDGEGWSDYRRAKKPNPNVLPVQRRAHGNRVEVVEHEGTGERFAVKVLSKTCSSAQRRALTVERRMLQRLQHPRVVRLAGSFETEHEACLVLELFDQDMYHYIRGRTLDESAARDLFRQVLEGLRHVHERNCVHRDIKPENLLVKDGRVVLADFGMALGFDPLAPSDGGVNGSSIYMAPEILASCIAAPHSRVRRIGFKQVTGCDMYSAGVLLHILLSGEPPYLRALPTTRHYAQQLELCRQFKLFTAARWAGVSEAARELVRGLLQPSMALRLTAADALAHGWITGSADCSPPPRPSPTVFPYHKRSPPCVLQRCARGMAGRAAAARVLKEARQNGAATTGQLKCVKPAAEQQPTEAASDELCNAHQRVTGLIETSILSAVKSIPEGPARDQMLASLNELKAGCRELVEQVRVERNNNCSGHTFATPPVPPAKCPGCLGNPRKRGRPEGVLPALNQ